MTNSDEDRLRRVEEITIRWDERFRMIDALFLRVNALEANHNNILVTLGGMKVKWSVAATLVSVVSSIITGVVIAVATHSLG